MGSIHISGKLPLYGEVTIQGSKNAALPMLAAAVLIPGVSVLKNCPRITDVEYMCRILESIGCRTAWEGHAVTIDATSINACRLPKEYVTRMRSSVILMGAMLGRMGQITLDYPGGCVIGDRPIDQHLKALSELGVVCRYQGEGLTAECGGLAGTAVTLDFPSVGATENMILAAVTAAGTTQLYQCAREPEIEALCCFLRSAGAKIRGEGTDHITIEGTKSLHDTEFEVLPDRIVAGTYLTACLAAGGEVYLRNAPACQLCAVTDMAGRMGARIRTDECGLCISRKGTLCGPGHIETAVYPGFPTDLQSPFLAALAIAEGGGSIRETIFNGRFRVVDELNRMGADIRVQGDIAAAPGGRRLQGRFVTAEELRGGAALVVAGLCAQGVTSVENRCFIDRGYEDICRDLQALGAEIDSW